MTNLQASLAPVPFPHLARSRNICVLWTLRMLIRLEAFGNLCESTSAGERDGVFNRLRLPVADIKDQAERTYLRARLSASLDDPVASTLRPAPGPILSANPAL